MKNFIYLLSCILILAIAGLFVLKNPSGKAWLTTNDLLPNTVLVEQKVKSITEQVLAAYDNLSITENSQKSELKIYRWKDSSGNWHYSDTPQLSGNSEEVQFDANDITVLPAFEAAENKTINTNVNNSVNNSVNTRANTAAPNTPNKIVNLYQDAKSVQKLMDNRAENIAKTVENNTK